MHCIVIGGGPAGMMAAGTAAAQGKSVTLLEKNDKLGRKLYITGKGRCNVTNATDKTGLMSQVITNPRFLHSAFAAMDSAALMAFLQSHGVPLKIERGGRVFPESDKASDITKALTAFLKKHHVRVKLGCTVTGISSQTGYAFQISTSQGTLTADTVIIATGGLSYPATGSTGDGYTFASSLGHTVEPVYPSLVPLITKETWVSDLEGLSLKNIRCTVKRDNRIICDETGEMMFTANGVTGPVILRASRYITDKLPRAIPLFIDLKPALTAEKLDERLLRDFNEYTNKNFANALDDLLPKRLIETIIMLSGIPSTTKVNSVTKAQRRQLVDLLKSLPLTVVDTAGYKEAVITMGGVKVTEVNPSTLMSKRVEGLFFAGEILDVDAMTGGYNLQIAFSTGYLAGLSAAKYSTKEKIICSPSP